MVSLREPRLPPVNSTLGVMSGTVHVRMEQDSDGTAQVFVEVKAGPFSGASSAWFNVRQIAEFGQSLATTYPIKADAPVELAGGYLSRARKSIEQLHVGLKFYPLGSLGVVGCRVQLVDWLNGDERPESQSSVAVELHCRYEGLRQFGNSLVELALGKTSEAVLQAK